MICRWCIALGLLQLGLALLPAAIIAEEIPVQMQSAQEQYARLSSEFVASLTALAAKCDELGMPDQAEKTRSWIAPRASGRSLYFLAGRTETALAADTPERVKQWHARFMQMREAYADNLFPLCHQSSAEDEVERGYRWLVEVLHENPDHREAKQILGSWHVLTRTPPARAAATEHRQFGWRRGRHWSCQSNHFAIESNVSAAACVELALELEQLHQVWMQVFYPVWTTDERMAGRLAGQEVALLPKKSFRVVLFKDREEYERQLAKSQPGVSLSSGVYFDEQKTSLFYAGEGAEKSTWYHEITHQLLQEYLAAAPGVAKESNAWMVEAAALFMESLVIEQGCAMLGGYDAKALQFARFRARGGDFQMPLAELVRLSREPLQTHADVRRIYGQMGGLGHFFMEGNEGKLREPFLETLLLLYRDKAELDSLTCAIETSYGDLDPQYYDFLDVTDAQIAHTPPHAAITALSLRKTSVTDAGLTAFAKCDHLQWLDLSLTRTSDAGFASFPASKTLTKLFLEGTTISDEALRHVAQFPELEELYLSNTQITVAGLRSLLRLEKLKLLDVSGCPLSDESLAVLGQFKQLESLDTSGTRITPQGLVLAAFPP